MESNKKSKKKKAGKERRLEREIVGVLLFLGFLVGVFLIANSYFKSLHNFEYSGLAFREERVGEIPVFHHSYYFKNPDDGRLINYNMFLRIDPRENNVSIEGDRLIFEQGRKVVFLSVDSEDLRQCRYSQLAVANLAGFLADNQIPIKSGTPDFWAVATNKQQWVTCENKPGNKVIEVRKGNETKIVINGNCYKVYVNNCEILPALEKLQVQSIVEAREFQQL